MSNDAVHRKSQWKLLHTREFTEFRDEVHAQSHKQLVTANGLMQMLNVFLRYRLARLKRT